MGEPPDIDQLLDHVYGSEGSRRDQALDHAVGRIEQVIKPRHTDLRRLQQGRRGPAGVGTSSGQEMLPASDEGSAPVAPPLTAPAPVPAPERPVLAQPPAIDRPASPLRQPPTEVVSGDGKEILSSRYATTQIVRRWNLKK